MASNSQPVKKKRKKRRHRLRWGRVAILVLAVLAIPALIWSCYKMFNPIALRSDHYIAQYKEAFDPYGNLKSVFLDSKNNVEFKGDVDTSTLGTTQGMYEYKGKEYPFTIEVKDTLGPDMTLKDVTTDTTTTVTSDSFIESISDASEYSVRLDGTIDPGQSGDYKVTITAKDAFDNTTTKTAKLHRIADKEAPEIENFQDTVTLMQGDYFTPNTYTAVDKLDENPTVHVDDSQLDLSTPGTYTVNYTASDRSGNQKTYKQTVTVEENPDYGKKIVYLTFDDGPSGVTNEILDELAANDVKATFFVTGANPEYYGLMKNIADAGHTVALHTYTHDYPTVYSSEEAYFDDLQKISDLVEQETGIKSNVIRFPGGSSNMVSADYSQGIMTQLVKDVQDRGYAYFDWNVDSTDASGNGVPVQTLIENATSGIGMDDVVILMHDTDAKETTAQALPSIIKAYKDAGYVFRPLTDKSTPVHHNVNN